MVKAPPDPWPAVAGAPRVVGLLGYPATYSLSPAMHNAAFRALGLPWVYTLFPVPPARLAEAVAGLRALGLAGANVTIPHKQAAAALVDELSDEARRCRAVNTLVNRDGWLVGYNTDVEGFVRAAAEAGIELSGRVVLVLGSGGAARAVAVACGEQQAAELWVAGRRAEAARQVVDELQPHFAATPMRAVSFQEPAFRQVARRAQVVVNATPLGTLGEGAGELLELVPPDQLAPDTQLMDLVYRPLRTRWVEQAQTRGLRAVGGGLMLLHQGARAFELWTGMPAPLAAMRAALEQALGDGLSPADTPPAPAH